MGAGAGSARAVLVLVCAAQFMVVLDVSVMNVALPSIRADLGFARSDQPWIVNAYALALAGLMLPGGRLADLFGHRRTFAAGIVLFSGASLVGGLAGTPAVLIGARALQGVGAAVLAPVTLTILATAFPDGPRRVRALAAWTAVGIAGGTAGNLLSGALTAYLSWRWTLLINVPIGVLALVAGARFLRRDAGMLGGRRLDVPGGATLTAALVSLTWAISRAQEHGWGDLVGIAATVVGIVMLAAFVVIEARFAAVPIVPLGLFRRRSVVAGSAAMLLAGACLNPMWFFLTLYLQNVLGYDPLTTGLAFLPLAVGTMIVGMRLTPWLMRRLDARVLIAGGALIAAAGFWWQSRITADGDYLSAVLGPTLVIAVGSGLLNTPLTTTTVSGVDPAETGAASGLMNTTKQIGAALGLAVLATAVAGGSAATPDDLAAAYGRAFLAMAGILVVVALMALTIPASRPPQSGRLTRRTTRDMR